MEVVKRMFSIAEPVKVAGMLFKEAKEENVILQVGGYSSQSAPYSLEKYIGKTRNTYEYTDY